MHLVIYHDDLLSFSRDYKCYNVLL